MTGRHRPPRPPAALAVPAAVALALAACGPSRAAPAAAPRAPRAVDARPLLSATAFAALASQPDASVSPVVRVGDYQAALVARRTPAHAEHVLLVVQPDGRAVRARLLLSRPALVPGRETTQSLAVLAGPGVDPLLVATVGAFDPAQHGPYIVRTSIISVDAAGRATVLLSRPLEAGVGATHLRAVLSLADVDGDGTAELIALERATGGGAPVERRVVYERVGDRLTTSDRSLFP